MAQRKKNTNTTAVAKQQPKEPPSKSRVHQLSDFLEGRRDEIAKILPQNLDVERVMKTAILAAMESEDIGQKCTPLSIYRSVVQASLMGLTVGSGFNEGYFIRYKNVCTFRASYLGWVKVAQRSDGVDIIRASVVYANDYFVMAEHPPALEHRPQWKNGERGPVVGAVAVAYTVRELTDGRTAHVLYDFSFVDGEDLDQAKKLADKYKESPSWRAWPAEMQKKVAVRRLCKWLPRNDELNRLTRIENSADNGVVDVPDPDIDNVREMVHDARFDEVADPAPAQLPPASPSGVPEAMPEPDVVDTKPPPTKAAQGAGKPSRTQQLKGQMASANAPAAPQAPQEDPSPPAADDAPDYGGPEDQGEMEF